MLTYYYKSVKDKELSALDKFKTGAWIYAESPNHEDIETLKNKFKLEEGLLRDALDPYEVPRLEVDSGVVYIFTRIPYEESGHITTYPFMIAVGKNFVCTVSQKQLPFLRKFTSGYMDFNTTQKTKLVLQLFSQISSAYQRFVTQISRRVRGLSVQLEKIGNRHIVQFVTFETVINDFLAALVPTRTVLKNLLSGKILRLYEEDKDLTEDLFLSTGQLIELSNSSLKNIVNIREAYTTIMSNNLNRIIKMFTALTVILTAPMVVSSFYGMNVNLPLAESPAAFWIITLGTLGVILVLLFVFVKNRWL